jgi:hypothetical protein
VHHAKELIVLDSWLVFGADRQTAVLVKHLRRSMDDLLRRKIQVP